MRYASSRRRPHSTLRDCGPAGAVAMFTLLVAVPPGESPVVAAGFAEIERFPALGEDMEGCDGGTML